MDSEEAVEFKVKSGNWGKLAKGDADTIIKGNF